MTPDQIASHARRIASYHLEDGIDFCCVYEDDTLMDADYDDQLAIHDAANKLIREIVL